MISLKKKEKTIQYEICKNSTHEKTMKDIRALLKDYKKIKNNQYQWKELYEQIDYCDKYDLLSYMSQFAHGLSMSNLVINLNAQNCDSVIGEALGLLDRMYVYVMEFFSSDTLYILEGLKEPEIRDKILACYDEEHRPSIKDWNRNFSIK